MSVPILTLDPAWEISQSVEYSSYELPLGDGYIQQSESGVSPRIEKWRVKKVGLTKDQAFTLSSELSIYAGADPFQWQPSPDIPFKVYHCKEWTITPLGFGNGQQVWEISAEFELDTNGECVEFLQLPELDENKILQWINGCNIFLATYTRNSVPLIINLSGLLVNAFHEVLGRGGYFPPSAGTTEGQYLAIRGCVQAYEVTGDPVWRTRAITMGNAAVQNFYLDGIPNNSTTFWSPHWLVNVKYPFTSKGLATAPDPLNYGYFDLTINFTNGVGQIPSGNPHRGDLLSDVYNVYSANGQLLWRNVYAPVVIGTEYKVEYWVSNYLLLGQRYRVYPTTASSSGTAPTPTNEPAGTIKLTSNFTGSAKLTYSAYTGSTIAVNQRFEAYPMWRPMLAGEIQCAFDALWWAYDAYDDLFRVTGDPKWQRARDCTLYSTIESAAIPNLTHFYKEDDNSDPFAYPGSQIVQVNNPNGYTTTRVTNAASELHKWLRVEVNAAPSGSFPSAEIQNFAVSAQITEETTIRVNAAHSNDTLVEIVLSTTPNAFDLSELYIANWLISSGSTPRQRTFLPGDFIRWRKANEYVVWYPTCADNPIYVFDGLGGSATKTRKHIDITEDGKDYEPVVWEIKLTHGGGYAGAGLVLNGKQVRRPPRFHYKHTGDDVILRLRDGSGKNFDRVISAGDGEWRKRNFEWSAFEWSDTNSGEEEEPNTQANIQAVEFHSISGEATIQVYWLSENQRNDPERLPFPCFTYKASFVSRDRDAHTFWLGNFRPINSPSDALAYNPGIVPFTVNSINGVVDAWRGIPLTGYQSPYHWLIWDKPQYLSQCLDYLEAAQDDYAQQNVNGTSGPWTPAFSWAYWDNGDFLANGLNGFGWSSPDPNTQWEGYMHRTVEAIARAWHQQPNNVRLNRLTMKFLTWVDSFYFQRGSIQPPTNYPEFNDPQVLYHCPHAAALIGRAALYANLAGGSPAITFRLIKRSLEYLESQYVSTGTMAGSFSAGQPDFVVNNSLYKEFFGFWSAEIIIFLCDVLKYKEQLRLPSCSTVI